MSFPKASVAEVLKHLMESNNLEVAAMARRSGISEPTIEAILDGNHKVDVEELMKLADAFNVPIAAFECKE